MKKKDEGELVLTTRFDVRVLDPDNKGIYQKVVNDIAQYRSTARKIFSMLAMSEIAGAKISFVEEKVKKKEGEKQEDPKVYVEVKPDPESSFEIKDNFAKIIDPKMGKSLKSSKDGKPFRNCAYAFRSMVLKEISPNWLCHVWDNLRKDVESCFNSHDPEFTKATRGWLIEQHRRNLASFQRKGLAILWAKSHEKDVVFADNKLEVTLNWNRELGPVKFQILGKRRKGDRKRKLDGHRYSILDNIRRGRWSIGTVRLSEYDGKLVLFVPYKPVICSSSSQNDPNRITEITIGDNPNEFFDCRVRSDNMSLTDQKRHFSIPVSVVVSWLDGLNSYRNRLRNNLRGCGNKHARDNGSGHGKAYRKICEMLDNITKCRSNGSNSWNHVWSKRLVKIANEWNCGKIEIFNLPQSKEDKRRDEEEEVEEKKEICGLLGRPWCWSTFKNFVGYNAKRFGIKVEFKNVTVQKVIDSVNKSDNASEESEEEAA